MKKILSAVLLSGTIAVQAQQVRPANSAQIYHEIAQLNNLVNVLYLAAHPDDENTRLIAWLVNDKHMRTAYLSLTRGDGGQNILGNEQGAALGLIRTHELMEARKLDGAEQYFTRAIDFGFSKNYKETFKHWNEDQLTSDVVWVMRKYRPDVVICRFPPNEQAGHGQHAASAILAAKAFSKAGDKSQYKDQLKYYSAWQPKRIVFNAFRFGSANTTSEDMYKLAVGQYSPVLGMGYGELAGISRSIHRSQGAGTPSVPGTQLEYFRLVDGDSFSNSLFDGIDISWGRVQHPEIGAAIADVQKSFDFTNPAASIPALAEIRKQIETVNDEYWKTQKLAELDNIMLDCAGLMVEATTKQAEAVRGATLPFTLRLIARSATSVRVKSIAWPDADTAVNIKLQNDTLFTIDHTVKIPADAKLSQPYWLQEQTKDAGQYVIPADTLLGYSEAPNPLNVYVTLKTAGTSFRIAVPLSYKKLDPTHGDIVEALRIVPALSLEFTSGLLVTNADGSADAAVHLRTNADIHDASLVIYSQAMINEIKGLNLKKGTDTVIKTKFTAKQIQELNTEDFYLLANVVADGQMYDRTQHVIKYEHLPTLQYFSPAYTKVLKRNWVCKAKRIGYIEGAGDLVDDVLKSTGLQVDMLTEQDISAEKLKKYDAVIVGIRAVNTEKRMSYWMPVLLKYANESGTLIMQYNTLQDLSTNNIGPYPFSLSGSRVTEEDADVTFLKPDAKVLNYPNKISKDDFKDWVQERGLYFATKWDEHYTPLFRMNDTGEQPQDGCTLYAATGKGHYIYTTLSFFRQLPAGNKGALRLLMNMINIGK